MLDYEHDTAPEPIDYRECAWLWMSGGGLNDNAHMREDFKRFPVAELADAAIEAWEQNPSEPLDRARFTAALEDLKESLDQAGLKPGDVS